MADPDEDAAVLEDLEVELYLAVLKREQHPGHPPDRDAVDAMEEPIFRMLGAAYLFQDLCLGKGEGDLRARGLDFLAGALHREAERLFRLYHGRTPDDG